MNDEEYKEQESLEEKSRKIYGVVEERGEKVLDQEEQENIDDQRVSHPNRSFSKWLTGIAVASLCLGIGVGGSMSFLMPYGEAYYKKNHHTGSKMGKNNASSLPNLQTPDGNFSVGQESQISPYDNGIQPPELDGSIVSIAKSIGPCVVSIYNNKKVNLGDMGVFYSGSPTEEMVTGLGSGVIFDQDDENYYIITNNHVVEGADSLAANFIGDIKAEAKLVGRDAVNDIAVVRVEKVKLPEEAANSLAIAPLGNSDQLEVGQLAVAIGTPATEALSNTVTTGIVSGVAREITLSGNRMKVIQTSAAINAGNSGGALVGATGEVIGINVAKTMNTEGIGFAIPINQVKLVVAELMENGSIERPGLGITGIEVSNTQAVIYGLPVGIYIQTVMKGGSADLAGIKPNDILIQFEGKTLMTMAQLKGLIEEKRIGDIVEVKVIREGEPKTFKLELKAMPQS